MKRTILSESIAEFRKLNRFFDPTSKEGMLAPRAVRATDDLMKSRRFTIAGTLVFSSYAGADLPYGSTVRCMQVN